MIIKSLIAATAVAASLVAFAPAPQAQAGVDIDINFGAPGYYGYGSPVYYGFGYGYPAFHPHYGNFTCHNGKNVVVWRGFDKVNAIDCSLPAYKYTGWKSGHKFLVSVNRHGNIMRVNRIF